MKVVELSNADVKKYSHVNRRLKSRKDAKQAPKSSDSNNTAFENQLPDESTVIKQVSQRQKHYFTEEELEQMVIDYTENKDGVKLLGVFPILAASPFRR